MRATATNASTTPPESLKRGSLRSERLGFWQSSEFSRSKPLCLAGATVFVELDSLADETQRSWIGVVACGRRMSVAHNRKRRTRPPIVSFVSDASTSFVGSWRARSPILVPAIAHG
jgi:hypothetical protein